MTRIPRTQNRAADIFRLTQKYLYLRAAKLEAENSFKAAAKPVREWLTAKDDRGNWEHGEEDADGNRLFRFPKPMTGADGKTYHGVMLRRTQGPATFNPDEVLAFARQRGPAIQTRVIKTIEIPDLDELYVLQQEGKITEAELRGLMHAPDPTWALWPVESADITEEE